LNIFSLYGYLDPVPDPLDVAPNYPDPDPVGKTHPAHPYIEQMKADAVYDKDARKFWNTVQRISNSKATSLINSRPCQRVVT